MAAAHARSALCFRLSRQPLPDMFAHSNSVLYVLPFNGDQFKLSLAFY